MKLCWLKSLRNCESGSALVETALTVPFLLALFLGAVEMGDFAYRATEMSNAARAAAQYGAMNGGGFADCNGFAGGQCSAGSGMLAAAKADAPRTATTCTSFIVTVSSSCTCSGDGTACPGGNAYSCGSASGKPITNVTVATSARCSPLTSIPGLFSGAFTLHGSAVEEVLQ